MVWVQCISDLPFSLFSIPASEFSGDAYLRVPRLAHLGLGSGCSRWSTLTSGTLSPWAERAGVCCPLGHSEDFFVLPGFFQGLFPGCWGGVILLCVFALVYPDAPWVADVLRGWLMTSYEWKIISAPIPAEMRPLTAGLTLSLNVITCN